MTSPSKVDARRYTAMGSDNLDIGNAPSHLGMVDSRNLPAPAEKKSSLMPIAWWHGGTAGMIAEALKCGEFSLEGVTAG